MPKIHHMERVPLLIRPWAEEWQRTGSCDLVCTRGGANDADQLLEWKKGRTQLADGSWVVTDKQAVVTYAMTAAASAHGHAGVYGKGGGAGADFHPVRALFPGGGVQLIYLGSSRKESPEVFAEGMRRFLAFITHAENFGLESGKHFPDPDLPHLQVRNWRELPLIA